MVLTLGQPTIRMVIIPNNAYLNNLRPAFPHSAHERGITVPILFVHACFLWLQKLHDLQTTVLTRPEFLKYWCLVMVHVQCMHASLGHFLSAISNKLQHFILDRSHFLDYSLAFHRKFLEIRYSQSLTFLSALHINPDKRHITFWIILKLLGDTSDGWYY